MAEADRRPRPQYGEYADEGAVAASTAITPGAPAYPPSTWRAGESYRIPASLATDPSLPGGTYTLAASILAPGRAPVRVELAAIIEATARLVPGVMGNATSALEESHSDGLLEYPHYTRPAEFRGWEVPEVLRSGDHARVARWRRAQSLARTLADRPDLIGARGGLTGADRSLLAEFEFEFEPGDPAE